MVVEEWAQVEEASEASADSWVWEELEWSMGKRREITDLDLEVVYPSMARINLISQTPEFSVLRDQTHGLVYAKQTVFH